MKILFASRNFFPSGAVGGAQTSIKFLAQSFIAQGHEAAVLSVDDHDNVGIHENTGVPEFRVKLKNVGTTSAGRMKLVWHGVDRFGTLMDKRYSEIIAEYAPDVIYTHVMAGLGMGIWRAAERLGVPIVHMVHDYYLLCLNSGQRKKARNCERSCDLCETVAVKASRSASSAVSSVIYVSDHVQRVHEAARVFEGVPAHIIHGSYEPGPVSLRSGLIENDRLTLGYFGRLSSEKGVNELLDALRTVDDIPWKLRIGGKGDEAYLAALFERAKGLPIEFLGVQNPNEFYSSVDMVVVPSLWHDPAPRVVYEAGMHGVFPLVSNRGGLPQLVDYGRRGRVFDLSDPNSLRECLGEIYRNPGMIEDVRSEWMTDAQTFSQAVVSQQVLEVLRASIIPDDRALAS